MTSYFVCVHGFPGVGTSVSVVLSYGRGDC